MTVPEGSWKLSGQDDSPLYDRGRRNRATSYVQFRTVEQNGRWNGWIMGNYVRVPPPSVAKHLATTAPGGLHNGVPGWG
jgi:hypothetical protein